MGGITEIRGIDSLINACEKINGTLVLAGKFTSQHLEQRIRSLKGGKMLIIGAILTEKKLNNCFQSLRRV